MLKSFLVWEKKYWFCETFFLLSEAKCKAKYGKGIKTLTSKQMLQRLLVALSSVKTGITSENSLNEFRQIIYSFYRENKLNNISNIAI